MAEVKPDIQTIVKIKVVGVGGSGCAAVNRMVESRIKGVDFIAMNTDAQDLHYTKTQTKLHIGKTVTKGLGAGMNPDLGRRAAEESQNDIRDLLKGADMVFVTCGLGGGTGSGASPVVAEIARDLGALTIAVVTKPFSYEGAQRREIAERAYEELSTKVDAVIVIPNDRILQIIDKKTSFIDALKAADEILRQGVEGISDLITIPGLINVDFADVKSIMQNAGTALMGIGKGAGENRAVVAAKAAVSSPLLETSIDGARGVLFVVTGGSNLTMHEVNEAAKIVTSSADENARVIFGTVIDESLKDEVKITVVATGFNNPNAINPLRVENQVASKPYTVNRYLEQQEDIEEDLTTEETSYAPEPVFERKAVVEKKKTISFEPSSIKNPSKPKSDDEDLDIPAFIRRKMN